MLIIPGGLFMYGWSAQSQTQFMVPLIGAGIFAFGMMITYVRLAFSMRFIKVFPINKKK